MTLEPSMLAVEQRLQRMVSEMPAPDVEEGWAALSATLAPPLAQVIPLRRKSFGRPIALAAAAALLVAGSAFAAVTHGSSGPSHVAPVASVEAPGTAVRGPHLHGAFAAASPVATAPKPPPAKDPTGTTPTAAGASGASGTGSSTAPDGSGGGTQHTKPKDDPNDLDQGTGNDGQHNDHGGGNNGAEGTTTHGQGH